MSDEIENDEKDPVKKEMIRFESEDLQEFNLTLKELGDQFLKNQDRKSEREYKIQLMKLENESKEIDLSKSAFRWDRAMILLILATLIVLSIFDKLPAEIGYILVAVIFSLLPFKRLKNAISDKILPAKEGSE